MKFFLLLLFSSCSCFERRLIKDLKHKFLCLVERIEVLCLQISFHSIVFIVLNTLLFLCEAMNPLYFFMHSQYVHCLHSLIFLVVPSLFYTQISFSLVFYHLCLEKHDSHELTNSLLHLIRK